MWIRGIHATNDSPVLRRKPAPFEMTEAEIDEILHHRFGLDRAALISALAGQGGDGREGQGAERAMPAGGGA